MPYDERLADRMRALLQDETGLSERKMFGGLGFMLDGNMAAAAGSGGVVLLRIDPARIEDYLGEGVERFEMNGRRLNGWLGIEPPVVATDEDLSHWLAVGVAYTRTLPKK